MRTAWSIVCLFGLAVAGIAQDASRAHIPYNIPDGTPSPPAPPKPAWVIPAADIITEKSHEEGGRTITVRQIEPITLPPPPAELPPSVAMTEVAGIAIGDKAEMQAHSRCTEVYWHDQMHANVGGTFLVSNESGKATLAHELSHVLSLHHLEYELNPEHRNAKRNLMAFPTSHYRDYMTDTKRLSPFQVEFMGKSRFTQASE